LNSDLSARFTSPAGDARDSAFFKTGSALQKRHMLGIVRNPCIGGNDGGGQTQSLKG